MPGFTSHHLFGQKIYKHLPESPLKDTIKKHLSVYMLGLQGPDIFFYNLPNLIKKGDKNLGSYMHANNTGAFFQNFVTTLSSYQDIEQEIAVSYLCGFLCHYSLDTTCHPYIYYKSGYLTTYSELSNEYYSQHRELETQIDTMLLQRYQHKLPSQFNKGNIANISSRECNILSDLLSFIINKTYENTQITSKAIKHTIHSIRYQCNFLDHKNSNRKKIISNIEEQAIGYPILSSIMPSDDYIDTNDCLNQSKKTWFIPWNPSEQYTDTFLDLFYYSYKKCNKILQLFNYCIIDMTCNISSKSSILKDSSPMNNFLQEIGNNSYHTGRDCSESPLFSS